MDIVKKAINNFKNGRPVLIYDSDVREGEVDMVFHPSFITYKEIYSLRTLAGGLICFVMSKDIASLLGLKFMDELLSNTEFRELSSKRLGYGDRPAFSLWVNYLGVKTGISDVDRALTIRKLYEVSERVALGDVVGGRKYFYENFMSPGHVPILISRGLEARRGHTELSELLARLAGLIPTAVIAEVLDEGYSMSLSKARELAIKLNTVLVSGDELLSALRSSYTS